MRKFFLIFSVVVLLAAVFFYKEIRKTWGITVKPATAPLISDGAADIPLDGFSPILGNPGAPVTVVEFADLACPKCKALHFALSKYVNENPQKARLVWKGLPIGGFFSAGDVLAHQAGYCVYKQDQKKFWQFVLMAMEDKNNLSEAGLGKVAQGLQLDTARWTQCLNSDEAKQAVASNVALANQLGFRGVPVVVINNHLINTDENIDVVDILKKFVAQ